jgi:hypothetical protein
MMDGKVDMGQNTREKYIGLESDATESILLKMLQRVQMGVSEFRSPGSAEDDGAMRQIPTQTHFCALFVPYIISRSRYLGYLHGYFGDFLGIRSVYMCGRTTTLQREPEHRSSAIPWSVCVARSPVMSARGFGIKDRRGCLEESA